MTPLQATFTREFSRLLWLLVEQPEAIEPQKDALRRVLAETRGERRVISLTELNHALSEVAQLFAASPELPWLDLLSARMAGHAATLVEFSRAANAADVLGVARTLARPPIIGDDGAAFLERVRSLAVTTVDVRVGLTGSKRLATPPIGVTPQEFAPDVPALPSRTSIESVLARSGSSSSLESLLRTLEGAGGTDVDAATRALDELGRMSEQLAGAERWADVMGCLVRLLDRLESIRVDEVRRAFSIYLRRTCTPTTLRELSRLMARRRELREGITRILSWTGETGADVLVSLLVESTSVSERSAYRLAIVQCPATVPSLLALLEDPRWYVVRNAAELLGEMRAAGSEGAVASALLHREARVRRAAAVALGRLGSVRAAQPLSRALADPVAAVRLAAAHALAAVPSSRCVPSLVQALDREGEGEVQSALLMALGAHPTDDAVDRLVQESRPGSLIKRKPVARRVSAAQALAVAGSATALAALRKLLGDGEREVRAVAERAMEAAGRESLTAGG